MSWERDKTLIVLCAGLVFFSGMVMLVVYTRPADVQLYGLFAGVFGQFSGALMMFLKLDRTAAQEAAAAKAPGEQR